MGRSINLAWIEARLSALTEADKAELLAAIIAVNTGRQVSMPADTRTRFEHALRRTGEYAPQPGQEHPRDRGLRQSERLI